METVALMVIAVGGIGLALAYHLRYEKVLSDIEKARQSIESASRAVEDSQGLIRAIKKESDDMYGMYKLQTQATLEHVDAQDAYIEVLERAINDDLTVEEAHELIQSERMSDDAFGGVVCETKQ